MNRKWLWSFFWGGGVKRWDGKLCVPTEKSWLRPWISIGCLINSYSDNRLSVYLEKRYFIYRKQFGFLSLNWLCSIWHYWQGQVKKIHVSRPDFYIKESGRAGFFICYFLLHVFFTHYYLPPGIRWSSNRSNINKTKHQILIKLKFV